MRIDCMILQHQAAPEVRALALRLEEMGFDGIWVADHLTTVDGHVLLEGWTTLAALAERTTRVRLGVLVTNFTYRNPALLAREALTVDAFADGRLEIGVGAAGTREGDAQAAGIDEWSPAERVDRFADFVAAVRALTGADPRHHGAWYRSDQLADGPHRPDGSSIPLMVAAQRSRTLAVAARHADALSIMGGWPHQGDELIAHVADLNARFDDLCSAAGRDPAAVRRSLLVGRAGIRWWTSRDAFDEFAGRVGAAGVTDLVVYAPPAGPPDYADAFYELLPEVLRRPARG